jgi:hypothetical protein
MQFWKSSGTLSHPKTSLKQVQTKAAPGHVKRIWSLVSVIAHMEHHSSPLPVSFFSSPPVCSLSWNTCHMKTFSFMGSLDFQTLCICELTTPDVLRIYTWIWLYRNLFSLGTIGLCHALLVVSHPPAYLSNSPIGTPPPAQKVSWNAQSIHLVESNHSQGRFCHHKNYIVQDKLASRGHVPATRPPKNASDSHC